MDVSRGGNYGALIYYRYHGGANQQFRVILIPGKNELYFYLVQDYNCAYIDERSNTIKFSSCKNNSLKLSIHYEISYSTMAAPIKETFDTGHNNIDVARRRRHMYESTTDTSSYLHDWDTTSSNDDMFLHHCCCAYDSSHGRLSSHYLLGSSECSQKSCASFKCL